ncbi:hypothetical protein [Microbacterium sp. Se5.02b]|uniref:hypothetical protein n=1 Tax=Microbacterium sp. Se5.02b TaxID=2864103 RepID=UPI001C68F9E5|nr:hypothetical protein [Microbacterium sp. Se5.02b]QYM64433.1 hypothetical protein K1X59_00390 [Microbacterium sp. Se5.02b]
MKIALQDVSKGRGGQALPSTSLEFHTGAVRFALAETEQRPTVLGLIASGRMRPDSGRVSIDGTSDAKALRRRVALVDAPDVSDPHPDITLAGVVGEELMFAGVGATPCTRDAGSHNWASASSPPRRSAPSIRRHACASCANSPCCATGSTAWCSCRPIDTEEAPTAGGASPVSSRTAATRCS